MSELPFDFKDIVEQAQDVILVTKASPLDEPGPEIVYVNRAFTRLTGYSAEEAIGQSPRFLQSGGTDKKVTQQIRQALIQQQPVRVTLKNYTKMGDEYWLDLSILPLRNKAGEVTHFAAIERDVTGQKLLEQQLQAVPKFDDLSGLYNRHGFDEIMIREFAQFTRTQNPYSLLLIDIDNFKAINDRHGQDAGNQVIQKLAQSFQLVLRSYDQFARVGEEKFCILLHHTTLEDAYVSAVRFCQSVQESTYVINDDDINTTVSIGISEVISSDLSFTDVIERAETALIQASNSGGGQVKIHKP